MTYAYQAVAYIGNRPAGWQGIYLRKEDYRPYRSAPPVRWTRISIPKNVADVMRTGKTYSQALDVVLSQSKSA